MKFVLASALLLSLAPIPAAADPPPRLGAPSGVDAVQQGKNVKVTWDRVASAQSYIVTAVASGHTCQSRSTACVFTGLPPRADYTFSVTARSKQGFSPPSAPTESLWVKATLDSPIFSSKNVLVGRSRNGRPIRARRQGNPLSANVLLVVGQMHGNEPAGRKVVKRLRKRSVAGNSDFQLWTIASMNPDGARRGNRYNARGVDLNRNFPGTWRRASTAGKRPGSEPETRAMMRFIRRLGPTGVLSFHQPWNTVLSICDARSAPWVSRMSQLAQLPTPSRPRGCGSWFPGTMNRWTVRTTSSWFVTVELNATRRVRPQIPRSVKAVLAVAAELGPGDTEPAGIRR